MTADSPPWLLALVEEVAWWRARHVRPRSQPRPYVRSSGNPWKALPRAVCAVCGKDCAVRVYGEGVRYLWLHKGRDGGTCEGARTPLLE